MTLGNGWLGGNDVCRKRQKGLFVFGHTDVSELVPDLTCWFDGDSVSLMFEGVNTYRSERNILSATPTPLVPRLPFRKDSTFHLPISLPLSKLVCLSKRALRKTTYPPALPPFSHLQIVHHPYIFLSNHIPPNDIENRKRRNTLTLEVKRKAAYGRGRMR